MVSGSPKQVPTKTHNPEEREASTLPSSALEPDACQEGWTGRRNSQAAGDDSSPRRDSSLSPRRRRSLVSSQEGDPKEANTETSKQRTRRNSQARARRGSTSQSPLRSSQQGGDVSNLTLSPKQRKSSSNLRGLQGRPSPLVTTRRRWKSNSDLLSMESDEDDDDSSSREEGDGEAIKRNIANTAASNQTKKTKPAVQDVDAMALRAAQRRSNRRRHGRGSAGTTDFKSKVKRVSSAPGSQFRHSYHAPTSGDGESRANAVFSSSACKSTNNLRSSTNSLRGSINISPFGSSGGKRGSLMKRLSDRSLGGKSLSALFSSTTSNPLMSDSSNEEEGKDDHSDEESFRTANNRSMSSMKVANDVLRSSIRAPAKAIAKTVVQAGSIASDVALSAGTNVGDAVVFGGKAALSAGTNVGDAMVYGGKTVVKGSYKAIKSMSKGMGGKKHCSSSSNSAGGSHETKKSKWEQAVEAMNEILDPGCPAFQHMTADQRTKMNQVRKLLLKSHTKSNKNKLQHVPPELILMQRHEQPNDLESAEFSSDIDPSFVISDDTTMSLSLKDLSFATARSRFTSSRFILEEYAGVNSNRSSRRLLDIDTMTLSPQVEEEITSTPPPPVATPPPEPDTTTDNGPTAPMDSPTASLTQTESSNESGEDAAATNKEEQQCDASIPKSLDLPDHIDTFVLPEFSSMDQDTKKKVFDILQWDSIAKWDFNIFELDSITEGHSMLFAGWAILGAPHSQQAMAKHMGLAESPGFDGQHKISKEGYSFMNELNIPAKKLYNFIKVIEQDYNSSNAYHCSTHGADVLQSLHSLIQKSVDQDFMKKGTKLQLFSILLAALVHDVGHFGMTNAFHKKLQTELTILYNDKSVMESWHVAHAFSRMLDLDLTTMYRGHAKDIAFSNFKQTKDSQYNLLCNATPEQFETIRQLMIDAVMCTDMTNHFAMVNATRELIMDPDPVDDSSDTGDTEDTTTWRLLVFMLHMADISGQAKGDPLFQLWSNRCFEEFFAQGDQEAALGLPISPNCDRHKVMIPESQVGFIKFVVEPAFEVLGLHIPFVQDHVMPIIHSNMLHYLQQQHVADLAAASAVRRSSSNRRNSKKQRPSILLDESIQVSRQDSSRALAA